MGNATIIKVIYHDIKMNKHEATVNSSFYHDINSVQATGKYGAIVSTTPVNHTYKIDDNCVDVDTFIEVYNWFAYIQNRRQLMKIANDIKWDWNSTRDIRGKRAESIVIDEWADIPIAKIVDVVMGERVNPLRTSPLTSLCNNVTQKFMEHINLKENEDMPKIVDYT